MGRKVRGIVYGWGRYVLGTLGLRTQFVSLVAFLEQDEHRGLVDDLAYRYEVKVIPHLEGTRFLTGRATT
jgi:hypothetical protein